jgi:hypothetical protein
LYTCLQVLNRFGPYGGIEPRTFLWKNQPTFKTRCQHLKNSVAN